MRTTTAQKSAPQASQGHGARGQSTKGAADTSIFASLRKLRNAALLDPVSNVLMGVLIGEVLMLLVLLGVRA